MSNSLYMKMASFRKLYLFFLSFFAGLCSNRTSTTYVLFILSMLVVEGADSIRSVFSHYFRKISLKSLNSLYCALSYAKFDSGLLCGRIAGKALSIIPKDLDLLPVFLCVDDTMVEKHGKKFEHVQKLFDHACHNGNKYMNGHCFVSVMLAIPVWHGRKYKYVGIPLGYKMWIKDGNSKLQIAADMIDQVMPVLSGKRNVIILCDSWYAKTTIFSLTKKYHNLDLICNAPVNTALYDIPPVLVGKKKRGAPRKHGAQITLDNFELSSETIDGYHVGVKTVMVNMLKWDAVYAFVTSPEKECGEKKKRLFISTIAPAKIQIFCAWYEKAPINQTGSSRMQYLPYMLYSNRWGVMPISA